MDERMFIYLDDNIVDVEGISLETRRRSSYLHQYPHNLSRQTVS